MQPIRASQEQEAPQQPASHQPRPQEQQQQPCRPPYPREPPSAYPEQKGEAPPRQPQQLASQQHLRQELAQLQESQPLEQRALPQHHRHP